MWTLSWKRLALKRGMGCGWRPPSEPTSGKKSDLESGLLRYETQRAGSRTQVRSPALFRSDASHPISLNHFFPISKLRKFFGFASRICIPARTLFLHSHGGGGVSEWARGKTPRARTRQSFCPIFARKKVQHLMPQTMTSNRSI